MIYYIDHVVYVGGYIYEVTLFVTLFYNVTYNNANGGIMVYGLDENHTTLHTLTDSIKDNYEEWVAIVLGAISNPHRALLRRILFTKIRIDSYLFIKSQDEAKLRIQNAVYLRQNFEVIFRRYIIAIIAIFVKRQNLYGLKPTGEEYQIDEIRNDLRREILQATEIIYGATSKDYYRIREIIDDELFSRLDKDIEKHKEKLKKSRRPI